MPCSDITFVHRLLVHYLLTVANLLKYWCYHLMVLEMCISWQPSLDYKQDRKLSRIQDRRLYAFGTGSFSILICRPVYKVSHYWTTQAQVLLRRTESSLFSF